MKNPPLKEIPDEDEDWFCPVCVEQKYQMEKEKRKSDGKRSNSKVQRLLESYQFRNKKEIASKIQICGKCDDMILYIENEGVIEESEKCIKCTKIFHKQCFNKKDKPSILCTSCSNSIQKQIPLTQKLIEKYFIRDQMQSLNELQSQRDDENELDKNMKKNKTNKKMIDENTQIQIKPCDEILDVDEIKRNERMQARLEKKAKLLKQQEEKQAKQGKKKGKYQEEEDEENDELTQIEKINDEYIKNSSCIQNKTSQVLSKKRKINDQSEFITNKQIEDSLTQPLGTNQNSDTVTLPLKQNSNISQYNDDSESTISTAYSTTNSDQTQNKNEVAKNKQKQPNSKGVKFLLPVPSSNPIVNLKCKQSLIYALKAKNITFCDDLTFSQSCTRLDNNAKLEPNLQVIDLTNQIIFNKFKEMTRQGIYAPVVVEEDKVQGFIVRAMEDIKAKTLITEYVGEVDYARNHIFDKNDSIMDLLRTARSKTSLVILPDKKGNLARFLSGINNSSKKSMARQNVQSVRFNISGESHVILYAKKNIKKGELLYYDYNAGGFGEYPTSEFV